MNFSLDSTQTRGLGNLEKNDLIQFESQYVDLDYFVVFNIEKDMEIPAVLLQLWKFWGGYDHAFVNVMENDLGLNQQVPFFVPEKFQGKILEITEYRPQQTKLSKKEETMFDVWPDKTSTTRNHEFSIPYKASVEFNDQIQKLVLPSWTPLQRLPLDRVEAGTNVEIWALDEIVTTMRVTKL